MARFVMVRDRRVHNVGIPDRPGLGIINTDMYTPLSSVFGRISAYSRWGRLRALFILAHGKAGFNAHPQSDGLSSSVGPGGMSMDAGGMGISLAAEGVRHYNVGRWTAIRGRVENIVVFSCAAADTQPGNEFTMADGRYLMGALAIHTGAFVYASNRIQYSSAYRDLSNGRFIHSWTGQLLRFSPDTGTGDAAKRAPSFDWDQVMAGRAR
jgi:hypothetical protein